MGRFEVPPRIRIRKTREKNLGGLVGWAGCDSVSARGEEGRRTEGLHPWLDGVLDNCSGSALLVFTEFLFRKFD